MKEKQAIDKQSYWVGIGASAGGLDALKEMCQSLPENANMIYIVAQHLSPNHDSMLTDLLSRGLKIQVRTISNGMEPKPNVIYVTPPQHDVYVEGNKLILKRVSSANHQPKPSVDTLFSSLAEEKKDHAIGVVLSGTGTDGSHGIIMIRASGGSTFAQDDESAAYDGMPRAAIDTSCVDFVLSPKQISKKLEQISSQLPQSLRKKSKAQQQDENFLELIEIVRRTCGVSFRNYKKATLHRRIERRMLANGIGEFDQYVELAKGSKEEVEQLYRDILISVTSFFRDSETFQQLSEFLKLILKNRGQQQPVRLWVVGCATGEEAYSLGMLLYEALGARADSIEKNLQIFATDVDTEALTVARRGIYNEASVSAVPEKLKNKYFTRSGTNYEVVKELKNLVLFSAHNIIEDPPFLRIDLITCRNLLIYFEADLQKKIYNLFHYALKGGGYLFLGRSESTTQVTDLFRPVKSRDRIFQKRSITTPHPHGAFLNTRQLNISNTSKPTPETNKIPELPETLVEQLGDTCVMVNENLEIEHIYGNATPFLVLPRGKPSLNLGETIVEPFKNELKPLVFKVFKQKKTAAGQQRKLNIDGKSHLVKLRVYPLKVDDADDRFLLVSFEIIKEVTPQSDASSELYSSEKIKELEDELAMSREHLQTVIEELETSNEELQSINEELQSANEELQSSNEELETTNEELQSTNEELVTMNDELNTKTNQLESATNLVTNISNSMSFPLLCIDKSANIIKANQSAINFFGAWQMQKNLFEILPKEFDTRIFVCFVISVI